MVRLGIVCVIALMACGALVGPATVRAQSDEPIEMAAIPPLPAAGPSPMIYPVPDPRVGVAEYQGRFLSPKCEPGRCGACERSSGCCLTKSIWHLLPCSCKKKSEGCACPPHFFCPRGHCRVRPTECVRIDYRPYETVMDPQKLTAAELTDYTKTRVSQPVSVDLYPVFEACCQDFWLEDDLVYMDDCSSCRD